MATLDRLLLRLATDGEDMLGDAARRKLYLDINSAQEEEHHVMTEVFDRQKSIVLPVLMKGIEIACDHHTVQRYSLERETFMGQFVSGL